MEVFGMARSPDSTSFDYLKEATAKGGQNNNHNSNNQNESISFLLDASAIAGSTATANDSVNNNDAGSLASTKEQKQAFYSLHDTAVSEFLSPKSPTMRGRTRSATNYTIGNTNTNNNNKFKSQLTSPKTRTSFGSTAVQDAERSLSPFVLPTLNATKEAENEKAKNPKPKPTSTARPKINTRRSISSTGKKATATTLATPGSAKQQIPQTPGGFWTTNTESKTFVNGLLSPFSPLLHSAVHKQGQAQGQAQPNNLATINDEGEEEANANQNLENVLKQSLSQTIKQQREEYMQYVSLQPCRKVSVVVRVTAVDENEDAKRCIFPHFKDELLPSGGSLSSPIPNNLDTIKFATPKGKKTGSFMSTPLSAKSANSKLSSPTHRRDVVVVNPTAFGKYIPTQFTMETAKLVAQVANIDSEDWARLYEFHHVMWPTPTKSRENNHKPSIVGSPQGSPKAEDLASSYNTMDSLSRAVVQDLLAEHESSLLISMGHESTCFGTTSNGKGNVSSIGLWPKIMNQCAAMLETKGVVRLTMVEILEGGNKAPNSADSFRDLLAPSEKKPPVIRLRHHDMKGAVLEGLTEVEIDSMPALLEALAKSRQRRAQRRKQNAKNGTSTSAVATAVIGTLHYWEHAVSFELNKTSNATVTCVELSANQSSNGKKTINDTLESITHRKSVVSLGQALRQLLLQQAKGTAESLGLSTSELNPVICYRETTLTKVLQRSIESSKIVLLASISPLSRDYEHTVFTLNYLRRMLVKPGNTLTSPFGNKTDGSAHNRTPPKTAKTDNRSTAQSALDLSNVVGGGSSVNRSILSSPEAIETKERIKTIANKDPNFLEGQLVSDPRQRLATLFTPTRKKAKPWTNVLDRMEESQKSTRGTPTAISLTHGTDTSTLGSNSNTNSVAPNSYSGPISPRSEQEEARQVVESPGSAQQQHSRQSWQPDDDDDDDDMGGVGSYEIPYEGDGRNEEESDEWDSEEEIERQIAASAHRRKQQLEQENEQQDYCHDNDIHNHGGAEGEEDGDNYNDENEGIEVDLDGTPKEHDQPYSLELDGTEGTNSQALPEINPEGSYFENSDEDDEGKGIHETLTGVTHAINNQMEEEFGQDSEHEHDGTSQEHIDHGDQPEHYEPAEYEPPHHVEPFTDEEWQDTDGDNNGQEGTEASSLGLNDQNEYHGAESPVPPSLSPLNHSVQDDSTEDPANQTNYDLPDEPKRDTVNQMHVHRPPPSPRSPYAPKSPYQVFNSYASPYSVTIKTSKSREYTELTNEREELRKTVEKLTLDLKTITEERNTNIHQYESEIEQLYAKLDVAEKAKHELETVASQAIVAQTSSEEQIQTFEEEKDQLQRTVDSLRNDMARMTEMHENQLFRHRAEIDDFQTKLDRARETQKEIEDIADEAVTAHKTQVEETKLLTVERDELHVTIESLKNTMLSLERDQGDHVAKYHHEIRQLHAKLEETSKDKRTLQQEADDFRFQLETLSEKLRLMTREREELQSTLSSVKGSAKKASGDHSEYVNRFKNEIQQLHSKLDDAHSEKRLVQKNVDEIRFEKDDLERRCKGLEEELSASRANTLRLEKIRREEQETIRKMNIQLRRKDSENMDLEHFRNELEKLKRHKDHLESLVAHRKVESSSALTQLQEELEEAKRKILLLEEASSTVRIDLSATQKENRELKEKLGLAYDENSRLSRYLSEREEGLKILQASCDNLESLRIADGDVIAKLKDDLRNQESFAVDVQQLRQKFARLVQDHDQLQEMTESRKMEYERSMEEKANEISAYANRVEALQMEVESATDIGKRYRNDAEAQLRSLQASEANLIQNLRHRDAKIDQLQNQMDLQTNEINALRQRETSSSQAESEIIRLQERLSKLELTLDITAKEKEEAVEKAKTESRSQKSLLNELKQSRDEIHRYKNMMNELNDELNQRQEENLKAKERIYQMESTLRTFKKETKERVRTFADRENDTNGVLERTRDENRDLNSNLRDMNNIVARLRRERDICFESLKEGRQKLSELSSRKERLTNNDELHSTPSFHRRPRSPRRNREPRTALRPYPPPVEAVTARATSRGAPEIFVTSYQLGSPTTLAEERAEEIAACVAQNAKESLVENLEEVSQLRSQIYRLEDERSEQVASLKAKVSNLEKELTIERIGLRRSLDEEKSQEISSLKARVRNLERELSYERIGNRTPVMGTSSRRSRKHNHFVDWDEKREY